MSGYLSRIRKLADLDGSIWWWPYMKKTGYRISDQPVRGLGKSGWASGVFACFFISQILGVTYDAPTRTLGFRPFSPSSDFTWDGFRIGNSVFSAAFKREESAVLLEVENHNNYSVTVRYHAILPEGKPAMVIRLGGEPYPGTTGTGTFFRSKVVSVEANLGAGEKKNLSVEF